MANFIQSVAKEIDDIKRTKITIESEEYGEVNYIAYKSKSSDFLLVKYMTFTDNGVKVKAALRPLLAIEYDMLMDFIGKDSFTKERLGKINVQVYLVLEEFDQDGGITIMPYVNITTIRKFIIPAISDKDKAARVRSWVDFIQVNSSSVSDVLG